MDEPPSHRDVSGAVRLLRRGCSEGVFSGAVLLAAREGEVVLLETCGSVSTEEGAQGVNPETLFDLASLTKPLATTLAVMKLVDEGVLELDQPIASLLGNGLPAPLGKVTPRLLLCHSAGLKAWHPFHLALAGLPFVERKGAVRRAITAMELAYEPGKAALYSDLGFMLLEWVVEVCSSIPLDAYVAEIFYRPMGLERLCFNPLSALGAERLDTIAATEWCPWRGRLIQGEVHDENAFFVGGVAGHAGLFGGAREVHTLLRMLMAHAKGMSDRFFEPATVLRFLKRQAVVEGSSWALGWDTPSAAGSSSGRFFSADSVGHLGFTGTSVWMDLDRQIEVILLTNRIHPTRENVGIRAFRPTLHDAVMAVLTV